MAVREVHVGERLLWIDCEDRLTMLTARLLGTMLARCADFSGRMWVPMQVGRSRASGKLMVGG